MKQKIFTFLLIAAAGLSACRKDTVDPTIKEYDETQIQNYIAANSLTGFIRDTVGGDTTGMYYKIINPGSGPNLEYSDRLSLVFTLKSFDGKYTSSDTIANHFYDYLGHLAQDGLPKGLQTGIFNLLKHKGASMRLLVPSHLAYGKAGYGTGSVTNVNTRIAGNQSLEYYVHVIGDQPAYDDLVIRNYLTANSLSGYTKTTSGLYYKVITPGTGVVGEINDLSIVTTTYTGALLNGVSFDEASKTTAYIFTPAISDGLAGLVKGVKEGLEDHAAAGTSISLLIPSGLGYGNTPPSGSSIPSFAPLRFEFQITTVTKLE
ncbi:FKBP-type peptidyl-prolyl cis-trans isomerase [Mucilaginibacter sp.]|uniref:FKBP-type peptidyl-prolyl cis-trans isomerase n=1 Tax=Mucilaginibacter sp. TaxID=1882438 RepID=UPI003266B145